MIQATLCDFGELLYNCFSSEIYKSPWTSQMIFKFNFFEENCNKAGSSGARYDVWRSSFLEFERTNLKM